MTISDFDKRVLIEQVRYIEAKHSLVSDSGELSADLSLHSDFDDRLWQRAKRLIDHNDLQSTLGRAAMLSRRANMVALLVAALLGASATLYTVTGSNTINIYWLLLVLLGFNLLSMLLWLVGISLHLDGLIAGILAKLTRWLPGHLKDKSTPGTQADQAWLACHFGGRAGKWQLSRTTHQLWLVYLFAGLSILVLALMARQYDFVWGTTLLSDAAFVKLTSTLSAPLQALGFATPSAEQIQDTRIGALHTLTAAHRYSWAQFLLGSLLCFGIVPRLLLWGWSLLMGVIARRHFVLDYYLPYYIRLRQQLMPLAGHGQIVDADAFPHEASEIPLLNPVPHKLPDETQWVSVELGADIPWPPSSISTSSDLGQVVDRESLARILQRLKAQKSPVIAIAVSAARPPDRGVQRTINSLLSNSTQRWLVLLQAQEQDIIPATRLAAWYRLAKACNVPADQVIRLSVA